MQTFGRPLDAPDHNYGASASASFSPPRSRETQSGVVPMAAGGSRFASNFNSIDEENIMVRTSSVEIPSDFHKNYRKQLCHALYFSFALCVLISLWALFYSGIPVVSDGAFACALPVQSNNSIRAERFQRLLGTTTSTNWRSTPVSFSDGNSTTEYSWREITLLYLHNTINGNIFSTAILDRARNIEQKMTRLPMWQTLCNEQVPDSYRGLCLHGDSFPWYYFGSEVTPSPEELSEGILKNVTFDGLGRDPPIELDLFLRWWKLRWPNAVSRWTLWDGDNWRTSVLKSSFIFLLPPGATASYWDAFLQEELEPFLFQESQQLQEIQHLRDSQQSREKSNFQMLYIADGLHRRDWQWNGLGLTYEALLGAFSILICTFAVTRRLVLSLMCVIVAATSSFLAVILFPMMHGKFDNEFGDSTTTDIPILSFLAIVCVAISCVDIAAATSAAWEKEMKAYPWWLRHAVTFFSVRRCTCSSRRISAPSPEPQVVVTNPPTQSNEVVAIDRNFIRARIEDEVSNLFVGNHSVREEDFTEEVYDVLEEIYMQTGKMGDVMLVLHRVRTNSAHSERYELGDVTVFLLSSFKTFARSQCAINSKLTAKFRNPSEVEQTPIAVTDALTFLLGWHSYYQHLVFCFEAYLAPVTSGCLLLVLASQFQDIPLLYEFVFPTGCGTLFAVCLGSMLFPVALELGISFSDRNLKSNRFSRCRRRDRILVMFMPVECGVELLWTRRHSIFVIKLLRFLDGWGAALLVALLIALFTSAYTIGYGGVAFDGDMPPLASVSDPSYIVSRLLSLFAPLPHPTEIIKSWPSFALHCTITAKDSYHCSFTSCEVDHTDDNDGDMCYCYKRQREVLRNGCSASARFWHREDVSIESEITHSIWPWIENNVYSTLGYGYGASANPVDNSDKILTQMQDWQSGNAIEFVQRANSLPLSINGSASPFELSCLQVLCYCGGTTCAMDDSWIRLGVHPISSARQMNIADDPTSRRIVTANSPLPNVPQVPNARTHELDRIEDGSSRLSLDRWRSQENDAESGRNSGQRMLAMLSSRRMTTSSTQNLVPVHATWGLRIRLVPPLVGRRPEPEFLENYDFSDPFAQRAVLSFCDGLSPELDVVTTTCWMVDFKYWLRGRGHSFPIAGESVFYPLFSDFYQYYKNAMTSLGQRSDYVWFKQQDFIGGTFVTFQIHQPSDQASIEKVVKGWNLYQYMRNGMLSSVGGSNYDATVIFPWIVGYEQTQLLRECLSFVVIETAVATSIVALILSCSLRIAIITGVSMYVAFAFAYILCILAKHTHLNVIDVLSFCCFCGYMLVPVLRTVLQYSSCQLGIASEGDIPFKLETETPILKSMIKTPLSGTITRRQRINAMFEREFAFVMGATQDERRQRTAYAMVFGGGPIIAYSLAILIVGIGLLLQNFESFSILGLLMIANVTCLFPIVFFVLPCALQMGFGPTQTQSKAHFVLLYKAWIGELPSCMVDPIVQDPSLFRSQQNMKKVYTPRMKDRSYTAAICDLLKRLVSRNKRSYPGSIPQGVVAFQESGFLVNISLRLLCFLYSRISNRGQMHDLREGDVGDSECSHNGPVILSLVCHGVTQKPPFHLVHQVENRLRTRG